MPLLFYSNIFRLDISRVFGHFRQLFRNIVEVLRFLSRVQRRGRRVVIVYQEHDRLFQAFRREEYADVVDFMKLFDPDKQLVGGIKS
jgi:hypothetical protein